MTPLRADSEMLKVPLGHGMQSFRLVAPTSSLYRPGRFHCDLMAQGRCFHSHAMYRANDAASGGEKLDKLCACIA